MKALIVASGQYVPMDLLAKDLGEVDLIVAIDGGLNYLERLGQKPHVFIGDQDSVDEDLLRNFDFSQTKVIKFPAEKDMTDMDLGLDYLLNNNCKELLIYGATGTRLDHSLANIFLLKKLHRSKLKAKLIDRNNQMELVDDFLELEASPGKYVSVLPMSEKGIQVTLKGFKYPLDKYYIEFTNTIGISNQIIGEKAQVIIDSGLALVIVAQD